MTTGLLEAMAAVNHLQDTTDVCHFEFCQRSFVDRCVDVCRMPHVTVEVLPLVLWHVQRHVYGADAMTHFCGRYEIYLLHCRRCRDAVHGVPSVHVVCRMVRTWKQVLVGGGYCALCPCLATTACPEQPSCPLELGTAPGDSPCRFGTLLSFRQSTSSLALPYGSGGLC